MVILPMTIILFVLLFVFMLVNSLRLARAEPFVTNSKRCSLKERVEYTQEYIVNQNDDYEDLYKGCIDYVSNVDLSANQDFIINEAIHYMGLINSLATVLQDLEKEIVKLESSLDEHNNTIAFKENKQVEYEASKASKNESLASRNNSKVHIEYLKSIHNASENMNNLESVIQGQVCSSMSDTKCGLLQQEVLTRQKLMNLLQEYMNYIPDFSKAYIHGVRLYHTYRVTNNTYNTLIEQYYEHMVMVKQFEVTMFRLVSLFEKNKSVFYNSNLKDTQLSVLRPGKKQTVITFNEDIRTFIFTPTVTLDDNSTFSKCDTDPTLCGKFVLSDDTIHERMPECTASKESAACKRLKQPSDDVSGLEILYRKKFARYLIVQNDKILQDRKEVVDEYLANYLLSRVFPAV